MGKTKQRNPIGIGISSPRGNSFSKGGKISTKAKNCSSKRSFVRKSK